MGLFWVLLGFFWGFGTQQHPGGSAPGNNSSPPCVFPEQDPLWVSPSPSPCCWEGAGAVLSGTGASEGTWAEEGGPGGDEAPCGKGRARHDPLRSVWIPGCPRCFHPSPPLCGPRSCAEPQKKCSGLRPARCLSTGWSPADSIWPEGEKGRENLVEREPRTVSSCSSRRGPRRVLSFWEEISSPAWRGAGTPCARAPSPPAPIFATSFLCKSQRKGKPPAFGPLLPASPARRWLKEGRRRRAASQRRWCSRAAFPLGFPAQKVGISSWDCQHMGNLGKTCFVWGVWTKPRWTAPLVMMVCLQITVVCFHCKQSLVLISSKPFLVFIFASSRDTLTESSCCCQVATRQPAWVRSLFIFSRDR